VVRFGKLEGEVLYLRRGDEPESYAATSSIYEAMLNLKELQAFSASSTTPATAAPGGTLKAP
jgi:hypothetical protein